MRIGAVAGLIAGAVAGAVVGGVVGYKAAQSATLADIPYDQNLVGRCCNFPRTKGWKQDGAFLSCDPMSGPSCTP